MATTPLADQETIDASYLGKLIGRTTKTIKVDVSKRPETLPPRLVIPGSRKILWRVSDVREWMEEIAAQEKARRAAAAQVAAKSGLTVPTVKSFHLGKKSIGHAANKSRGTVTPAH